MTNKIGKKSYGAANTLETISGESVLASQEPGFLNYRAMWEERPRQQDPGEFPLHLDLESTSACNLKCTFCWANEMRDDGGFFDMELYLKVLAEGAEYGLCAIKYNLRGEPLLHPKLSEMIVQAKDAGVIDIFFNTNGLLLTETKINQLIDAGLNRLTVSFEGYEKDFYEKYRVGSDYDKVVANVKLFQKIKRDRDTDKPKIRVQTVRLPELEPFLPQYKQFWETIADEVTVTDLQGSKFPPAERSDWVCPFIFQRMTILWDGTMLPCDRDMEIKHPLGNVKDTDIHEAWTGSFMSDLREQHRQGKADRMNICAKCSFRHSELKKLGTPAI